MPWNRESAGSWFAARSTLWVRFESISDDVSEFRRRQQRFEPALKPWSRDDANIGFRPAPMLKGPYPGVQPRADVEPPSGFEGDAHALVQRG